MDIIIRKLSPAAVKQIERLAKDREVSREEYLRNLLEDFSFVERNVPTIDRLEKQLTANTMFLEKVDSSLQNLLDYMKEMMLLDDTSDSH
ncbi:hypothetical protein [Lysinibacillus fusiformis]|uniref:hypothetical protein n=1 Tax=Lysinibacillus fusiformis TaxID=28031 RepID=UPI000D35E744|nr:hypothetical protein [Lysinibacillus fusiformis]MED4672328.1 hypothetical protein [Lysinibacillus fusiformis]RDV25303.1 hypothetical protein C7B90_22875 [Lysinibacillus fusiformis]GED65633.1 hypothetical protein LFU01_40850 [Lysinibacillus fusiformis]